MVAPVALSSLMDELVTKTLLFLVKIFYSYFGIV